MWNEKCDLLFQGVAKVFYEGPESNFFFFFALFLYYFENAVSLSQILSSVAVVSNQPWATYK